MAQLVSLEKCGRAGLAKQAEREAEDHDGVTEPPKRPEIEVEALAPSAQPDRE